VGVIRNTPLLLQLMFWYFGCHHPASIGSEGDQTARPRLFDPARGLPDLGGGNRHLPCLARVYHHCIYFHSYRLVCITDRKGTRQRSIITLVESGLSSRPCLHHLAWRSPSAGIAIKTIHP
jgi:hypothetical protein